MSRPWGSRSGGQHSVTRWHQSHIVLLVLVVGHDGDDGVVDEESQGQDSSQGGE